MNRREWDQILTLGKGAGGSVGVIPLKGLNSLLQFFLAIGDMHSIVAIKEEIIFEPSFYSLLFICTATD